MKSPQKYQSTIISKKWLNSRNLLISLKLVNPSDMIFKSGNFINVSVGEGIYRVFSIASSPAQKSVIDIVVAASHDGKASNFFRNAEINDPVEFIGPSGRFYLPEVLSQHLIFAATGTGLAPFIPMLHALKNSNYTGRITLYLGVRTQENIIFEDLLKNFAQNLNFDYRISLSKPQNEWDGLNGRINNHLPIDTEAQYFLCGHPEMVADVSQMLINKGIAPESIYSEKFIYARN